MLEKVKTFKGGHAFGTLNGMPKARIRHCGVPMKVVIPLRQGFGDEVKPIVKKGDKVKAGQIIAIDDNSISSPIHASVNGTISDCESKVVCYENNNKCMSENPAAENQNIEISSVTIESDGLADWQNVENYVADVDLATVEGAFKKLYMSGVTALGLSGIPSPHNTSPVEPDKVTNIVINATNSEPFSLPVSAVVKTREKAFITGLNILSFLFPDAEIDIAIDSGQEESIYGLFNALNGKEDFVMKGVYSDGKLPDKLHINPVKPKYPQGNETVLVETLIGVAPGPKGDFSAIEHGVIVLAAQDVLSIYEAVIEGKPLIERIVALGGAGHSVNHCVGVRIGSSLKSVISHRHKAGVESRIILNSIMTGPTLQNLDIPITKSTNSIISLPENKDREFQSFLRPGIDRGSYSKTFLSAIFRKSVRRADTNINGEPRPCISCNYCEYACPVNILPFLISKYVEHDMVEETEGLNIFDCVECGLCSYVCPSKIPILKHIAEGKQKIRIAAAEDAAAEVEAAAEALAAAEAVSATEAETVADTEATAEAVV